VLRRAEQRLRKLLEGQEQPKSVAPKDRRRDKPDYDHDDLKTDLGAAIAKLRKLESERKEFEKGKILSEVKDKIHGTMVTSWVIFYVFLKSFTGLSHRAQDFFTNEAVAAAIPSALTWLLFQMYKAGPLWCGFIALIGASLVFLMIFGLV
jgi:hypothetical protein